EGRHAEGGPVEQGPKAAGPHPGPGVRVSLERDKAAGGGVVLDEGRPMRLAAAKPELETKVCGRRRNRDADRVALSLDRADQLPQQSGVLDRLAPRRTARFEGRELLRLSRGRHREPAGGAE